LEGDFVFLLRGSTAAALLSSPPLVVVTLPRPPVVATLPPPVVAPLAAAARLATVAAAAAAPRLAPVIVAVVVPATVIARVAGRSSLPLCRRRSPRHMSLAHRRRRLSAGMPLPRHRLSIYAVVLALALPSAPLPRAYRAVASTGRVGRARLARLRPIHRRLVHCRRQRVVQTLLCRRPRITSRRARASPSISAAKAAAARSALVACASAAAAIASAGSVSGGGGARPPPAAPAARACLAAPRAYVAAGLRPPEPAIRCSTASTGPSKKSLTSRPTSISSLRQHRRLSLAHRRLQPRHSRFVAAAAAAQPSPVHVLYQQPVLLPRSRRPDLALYVHQPHAVQAAVLYVLQHPREDARLDLLSQSGLSRNRLLHLICR